jgi:hypothetical protein
MPVRPFASQEIDVERIDRVALRALKRFERNMREGRKLDGRGSTPANASGTPCEVAERLSRLYPDTASPCAQRAVLVEDRALTRTSIRAAVNSSAVISVGTNAELVTSGEVQITPAPLSTQERE